MSQSFIGSKLIGNYDNGNYHVLLFNDGTKIRSNDKDELIPTFPESIDLKITNCCDMGCKMCHEESVPGGRHGDLNAPFLSRLHPGTELAIGGGNPLEHPDLIPFLKRMKARGVICNMTVNKVHLFQNLSLVSHLVKDGLVHGLGISISYNSIAQEEIDTIKRFPHAVIHVIAGMVDEDLLKLLYDEGLTLLILGYKTFGRGIYYKQGIEDKIQGKINSLGNNIMEISKHFRCVSFDNLAIKQLHIQDKMSEEEWNERYMGDDGQYTMYIDLVKQEFAVSSISPRHRGLRLTIEDMFNTVRNTECK